MICFSICMLQTRVHQYLRCHEGEYVIMSFLAMKCHWMNCWDGPPRERFRVYYPFVSICLYFLHLHPLPYRVIHQSGWVIKDRWVAILRIFSFDKHCTFFIDRNESWMVEMSQIIVMRNFEKLEYGWLFEINRMAILEQF